MEDTFGLCPKTKKAARRPLYFRNLQLPDMAKMGAWGPWCLRSPVSCKKNNFQTINLWTRGFQIRFTKIDLCEFAAHLGGPSVPLCDSKRERHPQNLFHSSLFQSEEIFLDMFEDEYRAATRPAPKVELVLSDASLLLPPTVTPLTGIDFTKRLPCGEVERARRSIRTFFKLRQLSLDIQGHLETKYVSLNTTLSSKNGPLMHT